VKGGILKREMEPSTEVGWCHQCGTLQLMRDAPWLAVPFIYEHYEPVPCCAVCREDEPWELGVWEVDLGLTACAEARHVTWMPDRCEQCGIRP